MSSSPNADNNPRMILVPFWMSRFYKDDEFEEQYNTPMVVKLLPLKVRKILWDFSRRVFGVQRALGGVTSQACHVFERYCAAVVRKCNHMSPSQWEQKRLEIKQNTMMLLGVCLMLASKMESTEKHINGKVLMTVLERLGYNHTLKDINASEREVFSMIGFQVPSWNNVQKIQIFVTQLGLSQQVMSAASLLMDLVDHELPVLYEMFKTRVIESPSTASSASEPGSSRPVTDDIHIRSMHLMAGVVLASVQFMSCRGEDVAPTAARLIRSPLEYVRWLGNIIFQFLTDRMAERDAKRRSEEATSGSDAKRPRLN